MKRLLTAAALLPMGLHAQTTDFETPRPIETQMVNIEYILPDDCSYRDWSYRHCMTDDGTLWMFDVNNNPKKVELLEEGDEVKLSISRTRKRMIHKKKKVSVDITERGVSDQEEYALLANCGFTESTNYLIINDQFMIGLGLKAQDSEGEEVIIPSLTDEWEKDEMLLIAVNNEDTSMPLLINKERREVADAYGLGETEVNTLAELDDYDLIMEDESKWSVFPNFDDITDEWEEGEIIHSYALKLEEWLGPLDELDDELIEWLYDYFGNPGWESFEEKQIGYSINIDRNEMAPLWRDTPEEIESDDEDEEEEEAEELAEDEEEEENENEA